MQNLLVMCDNRVTRDRRLVPNMGGGTIHATVIVPVSGIRPRDGIVGGLGTIPVAGGPAAARARTMESPDARARAGAM